MASLNASEPAAATAGWSILLQPAHRGPTLIICAAILLYATGIFITATVLPSALAEIGGAGIYTWAVIFYMVASIVGAAAAAAVRSRWPLRESFLAAAAVYLLGGAVCALAPAMAELIVGRALQGLGGGLMMGLAYGLIDLAFAPSARPRILASISAMWGIAALLGPALGGGLAGLGLWRAAFWALVAGAIVLLIGARPALPTTSPTASPTAAAGRLPWRRLGIIVLAVTAVALASQVGDWPSRIALVLVSIVLLGYALWRDDAAVSRLFPRRLLVPNRVSSLALWLVFLVALCASPFAALLPLALEVVHGASPALAGGYYTAFSLAWTVAALLVAGASSAWVTRCLLLGPLAICAGMAGLIWAVAGAGLAAIAGLCVLTGLGIGLGFAHTINRGIAGAEAEDATRVAGAVPTLQALGIAYGSAIVGSLANAAGLAEGASPPVVADAASLSYGFTTLAALCVVVCSIALVRASRAREAAG